MVYFVQGTRVMMGLHHSASNPTIGDYEVSIENRVEIGETDEEIEEDEVTDSINLILDFSHCFYSISCIPG